MEKTGWKSERIVPFVGAVCFLALFFPCFIGPLAPEICGMGILAPATTWAGCAVGGVLAVAVSSSRRASAVYLGAGSTMAWGALLALSCAPSLVALFSIEPTIPLLAVCDFLRGASLVALGVRWTMLFEGLPFGRLLAGVAAASLVAVAIDFAQPVLHAGGALVLAVGAVVPLLQRTVQPASAVAPSAEGEGAPKGRAIQAALPSFFRLLASSTLGFALLVVLDQAQMQTYFLNVVPVAPLGIAVAAAVFVAIALALREELTLPFIQWVLFPVIAAVLLVLDSFPLASGLFRAGSLGVFLFFSMLGLFAVALLVKANGQGELSPTLTTGLTFASMAAAAWAGRLFVDAGVALDDRGALLLPLATVYLVFLLVSPALRLWREVRGGSREDEPPRAERAAAGDSAAHLEDRCGALAVQGELSPREAEVLKLAARGYTSTYISKALFISDSTVRTHLKSVYRKLGVSSKVELIELVQSGVPE